MRPKRPSARDGNNDLSKMIDELKKDSETAANSNTIQKDEMNKAMKKMAAAIEEIASDEEKKSFAYKEGGIMTQVITLAEAFEIVAARIKDIDEMMAQENGQHARSLPKPKR